MIPRIIIDKRELNSQVPKELEKLDCNLEFEILEVADYVVSGRVGFERKTAEDWGHDFIETKQFFPKLLDLKKAYEIPILIFECDPMDIFTVRNIPNDTIEAILNTIALHKIPVRYTYNAQGTAKLLKWFALREQTGGQTQLLQLHGSRRKLNPQQKKEYVLSAIDGIGAGTAIKLLEKLGSIEAVINASVEQLAEVERVGLHTAHKIKEICEGKYK